MSTMTMTAFDTCILNCASSSLISSHVRCSAFYLVSGLDCKSPTSIRQKKSSQPIFRHIHRTARYRFVGVGMESNQRIKSRKHPDHRRGAFIVRHFAWVCEISSFAGQSSSAFSSRGVIVPVDPEMLELAWFHRASNHHRSSRHCVCLSLCLCSTKRSMFSTKTSQR